MTGLRKALAACCTVLTLVACTDDPAEPSGGSSSSPSASDSASDSASASTAAPSAAAPPPAPTAGACYRLTLEDAARPTHEGDPVKCTGKHTARTIHVGQLDTVVDGHAVSVDSDRVQQQLAETCPQQLAEFLGGSAEERALSRFQAIWFSPTIEEHEAGADWFRCDVVAVAGSEKLLDLPADDKLRGILDRPGTLDTYGLCGTAQPGARGFERVACALRHSWVAIGTIPISGGNRYPGVARVRQAGDEACSDEVRARNDLVLEYQYGWEWPTADQWAAGQRFGFCWAPNDLA